MAQTLEEYRTGAGLESLTEVTIPRPQPGPDQLLARHDACSICFSDIKIIGFRA